MRHVYKYGGALVLDGVPYHIVAVNDDDIDRYLNEGWVLNREEVKAPRTGSAWYRYEIKKLGVRPPPNASVDTLKKIWEKLSNGPNTQRADR